MPIIRSAKKKLRQDVKQNRINLITKNTLRETIKEFKKAPTPKLYAKVESILDRASKKNIFHPNKSARLKSRLAKLLSKKAPEAVSAKAKPAKRTASKTSKT